MHFDSVSHLNAESRSQGDPTQMSDLLLRKVNFEYMDWSVTKTDFGIWNLRATLSFSSSHWDRTLLEKLQFTHLIF